MGMEDVFERSLVFAAKLPTKSTGIGDLKLDYLIGSVDMA